MKKLAILITALVLAVAILASACSAPKPAATTTQEITGQVTGASVPADGAPTSFTVNTATGPQTVQIAANTTFSLDGKTCPVEDLGQILTSGNTTYNCTAVVALCQPGVVAEYIALYTIN